MKNTKYSIPSFEDEMEAIRRASEIMTKAFNKIQDHDCKMSPDSGCEVCVENWEINNRL